MSLSTFLLAFSIVLLGSPLRAQVNSIPPETERAILHAVAEQQVKGIGRMMAAAGRDLDVVFDYAILPPGKGVVPGGHADPGAPWPAAVLDVFERIPGVRVGTLRDHITCPADGPPGYCLLEGADVVITFGRPELDGDSGRMIVRRFSRASGDINSSRAYFSGTRLQIAKIDGKWKVVGADFVSVSDP